MESLAKFFLPGKPIRRREMLVGRTRQLNRIQHVLKSGGRAIVITGTRGIGKTSLANVSGSLFGNQIDTQCHTGTTFSSWGLQLLSNLGVNIKIIEETVEESLGANFAAKLVASIGISGAKKTTVKEKGVGQVDITPDILFTLLLRLAKDKVIIVDEFDRIPKNPNSIIELFGDFIKLLGNRSDVHELKIIFVGVSSSARILFNGHPSIKRNVVPIHLSRLSQKAVKGYLSHIMEITDYSFDPMVVELFQKDFKGFPHFVHLVGESCISALPGSGRVSIDIYEEAVDGAIDEMLGKR